MIEAPFPAGLVLSSTLVLAAFSLSGADLTAGKSKAQRVCQTCHGMDGKGNTAMVANIGGQQKQYLVKQLEDYRSGKRQHAQMSIIAQMLSKEDIDNVTEWYSSIVVTFEMPDAAYPLPVQRPQ